MLWAMNVRGERGQSRRGRQMRRDCPRMIGCQTTPGLRAGLAPSHLIKEIEQDVTILVLTKGVVGNDNVVEAAIRHVHSVIQTTGCWGTWTRTWDFLSDLRPGWYATLLFLFLWLIFSGGESHRWNFFGERSRTFSERSELNKWHRSRVAGN